MGGGGRRDKGGLIPTSQPARQETTSNQAPPRPLWLATFPSFPLVPYFAISLLRSFALALALALY